VLVERLLSFKFMVAGLLLCFVPIYIPIMAKYEGRFFPVVANTEIVQEYAESCPDCRLPHLDVFLTFDKVRQCEFINLSWFDETGRRVRVEFEPEAPSGPVTRPTGSQVVGPWRIFGIDSLEGTHAVVEHQCHPIYRTYTTFYP
jgi:hypothetical protein